MLSLIIPTLNAAASLEETLSRMGQASGVGEVIIADGGSTDATLDIAAAHGAVVIRSEPGRGVQLAAGASAAKGDWFLFWHADTVCEDGWNREAIRFMDEPGNRERAACYTFRLDDDAPQARRVERLAAWRGRAMSLPYGDQGLLISRQLYDAIGGFRPLPLMEDVDLVRRIGRHRLARLESSAITSAERYQRGGYILRPLRNLMCLALYFIGVSPRLIARLYD